MANYFSLTRKKLWLSSAVLYLLFFCWYTDFGGPLSDTEIDEYVTARLAAGADPATIARMETFMRADTGRQFLMINAIDYDENPANTPGAEPGENAEQLMARYMKHMIPALLSRASHPVIMGDSVFKSIDLLGIEGAEEWDSGAIFRYRSRRTFFEIVGNPDFAGEHHFKSAALEKTIAYPIETNLYMGDLRWLLGLFMLALTALLDAFVVNKRR